MIQKNSLQSFQKTESVEILGMPHAYQLTPPVSDPAAPVLVFIHGWLLSRHYWQPLVERSRDCYQCLAYDLRGFGDSQIRDSAIATSGRGYTLAEYAEDLNLLLQTLNLQNVWLIGHSLGGSIALWAAKLNRDRILGTICINAGGGIYLKEEFERFRTVGTQLVKRRPRWLRSVPGLAWLFARAMVARPLERRWGKQRLVDFLEADPRAALGSLLETTTEAEVHQLPQVVASLERPTYFLAGDRDNVMELKYVLHLASFHPLFENCGRNVIEIAECGHLAMLEQPDLVAAKIRSIVLAQGC
ncbi:MAG: alpha/beta hydrolase [Cyanobacteriota bacterium]|nr:alpha/beta hydrolase [Cyanobacteriota bacterium]